MNPFFVIFLLYSGCFSFQYYLDNQVQIHSFLRNSFYNEKDEGKESNDFVRLEPRYEDKFLQKFENLVDDSTLLTLEEETFIYEKTLELKNTWETERKSVLNTAEQEFKKWSDMLIDPVKMNEYINTRNNNFDNGSLENKPEVSVSELENNLHRQNVVDMIKITKDNYTAVLKIEEKTDEDFRAEAKQIVMDKKHDILLTSILLEKTPLGNVLMFYNNKKKSFIYYSDNTIPYRFLEVVGRRYVVTFNCKSVYVNMSEAIKDAKDKIALEQQKKKDLELELEEEKNRVKEGLVKEKEKEKEKKDVFAKFKSYNKDTSKSSASNTNTNTNMNTRSGKDTSKMILKDRANRYTCEGKMSNFDMLKKVDKKLTDKRQALTFADFKRLKQMQKEE